MTTGTTPLYQPSDLNDAIQTPADTETWLNAGSRFNGGTLKGLLSKLGYLKRMGVTAVWIGPVFKNVQRLQTYHGYGVQNFLDIDPRFGTKEDLKNIVTMAHSMDMYVILDIIL